MQRLLPMLVFLGLILHPFHCAGVVESRPALLEKAKAGESRAQNKLAHLYQDEKNFEEALYWFRQGEKHGPSDAYYGDNTYSIGYIHFAGQGIAPDCEKAREWYERSAAANSHMAMHNLGCLHEAGQGTGKNDAKAAYWYEKAAELGDPRSQYNIGNMYRLGRGVEKNMVTAIKWYEKAAIEHSFTPAMQTLAMMYVQDEGVERNWQLFTEWYLLEAMNKGFPADMQAGLQQVGLIEKLGAYATAQGAETREKELEKMNYDAEQGDSNAQVKLFYIYFFGVGKPQDRKTALTWLCQAVDNKNAAAELLWGKMLCNEKICAELAIPHDQAEGLALITSSAEKQYEEALLLLAAAYGKGHPLLNLSQDVERAFFWATKAAQSGSVEGKVVLASMYIEGVGTEKNETLATEILQAAAQAGSPLARYTLHKRFALTA